MNKRLQKNLTLVRSRRGFGAAMMIAMVAFSLLFQFRSKAQEWPGPLSPPTDQSELQSILNVDDLISTTAEAPQTTSASVRFGTEIGFSGIASFIDSEHVLSPRDTKVGLIANGVADADAAYLPPLPWASSSGIVGHAGGGNKNYGLLAITDDGIAIAGRADAPAGYGAYFEGNVNIEDSPYAAALGALSLAGDLVGTGALEASPTTGYAIAFTQSAPFDTVALLGISLGAGIGIHGYSGGASGLVATSTDDAAALDAFSETSYGLYGYSAYGTGIIGETKGSAPNAVGIYGKGYDKGVYGRSSFTVGGYEFQNGAAIGDPIMVTSGVGVLACGTEYAALFEGSVRTLGSLGMGIEEDTYIETANTDGDSDSDIIGRDITPDLVLNETSLITMYTLCQAAGICTGTIPLPGL